MPPSAPSELRPSIPLPKSLQGELTRSIASCANPALKTSFDRQSSRPLCSPFGSRREMFAVIRATSCATSTNRCRDAFIKAGKAELAKESSC